MRDAHMQRSPAVPSAAIVCLVALSIGVPGAALCQTEGAVVQYSNPTTTITLGRSATRLDVGGADSVDFHRIAAILPREDGTFVVVNSGTHELRFFDARGRFVSTAGRRGSGPGEYRDMQTAAFLPGDSIAVLDRMARRISILDPRGSFVRSFPLAAPFEGGGSLTQMVAMANGSLFVGYSEVQRMAPQPTAAYFGQRLFSYSTTGELRSKDGLALPASEHFVQAAPPTMGGVAYWSLAFGRVMTIRADSSALLTGDGTDWAVEVRTPGGTIVRRHRLDRPLRPVTAQDRDAYRKDIVAGARAEERPVMERLAAEVPFPATKPAYRRFETDDAGRIWLDVYPERAEADALWIRLDPRTRRAVAVQFPSRFRPMAFTTRLVYGVWRDSDDVEHVQVFALEGL